MPCQRRIPGSRALEPLAYRPLARCGQLISRSSSANGLHPHGHHRRPAGHPECEPALPARKLPAEVLHVRGDGRRDGRPRPHSSSFSAPGHGPLLRPPHHITLQVPHPLLARADICGRGRRRAHRRLRAREDGGRRPECVCAPCALFCSCLFSRLLLSLLPLCSPRARSCPHCARVPPAASAPSRRHARPHHVPLCAAHAPQAGPGHQAHARVP